MRLAIRLALREMRGGVRGLGVVLLCLALGVGAIAAVGGLRASVERGLAENGRALLGGDVEVQTGGEAPPPALIAWLRSRGALVSKTVELHSLLVAPSGRRALIDLKAVDSAWPLVGAVGLAPPIPLARALAARDGRFGLLADPLVLDRLGVKPGDVARIGTAAFTVRAALVSEPDRAATPALFGAPVVIAAAALPATSLIVPGSIVTYAIHATLPGRDAAAAVTAAFPDRGWRVRGPGEAAPGVARFVDQMALFLTLVGLTTLLVGGVGVASGVRAWLEGRARALAILRCLGASSRLLFGVAAIQAGALALCGIAIGLGIGAVIPPLAARFLPGTLPVAPAGGVYAWPLALACVYGVLTAACFGLPPLARAMRISGAALFRDGLIAENARAPIAILALTVVLAGALVALAVWTSADRRFAFWFCVAASVTLLLYRVAGAALTRVVGRVRIGGPAARLGLASLRRPGGRGGAPTRLMLTSVGLGLSTLATVALIQGNIAGAIVRALPADTPSFYFVDIQADQLARFDALIAATQGAADLRQMPSLRARVVAVNGVPAERVRASPDTEWALRGDRGLTYAAAPPPDTRLLVGRWWPPDYTGPPLVSMDAHIARGWGVGLGAVIRVNVLGRDVDLRVANLRDVDWRSFRLNFVMVTSPGLLSGAPHTEIATVRVPPASRGALLNRVSDALPNVTGVSVSEILRAIVGLLSRIAAALAATGGVTLAAGCLVLVGAVAAGRRARIQEAMILKALGATPRQLHAAWLVEFGTIGLIAGVIAACVGTAASWAVMRFVVEEPWIFLPARLAGTLASALALMLIFGYSSADAAPRTSAAGWLRDQ